MSERQEERLHPFHIGRGLGEGGCLFLTFSAPEKVKHRYDIKEKNLFERETKIEILL